MRGRRGGVERKTHTHTKNVNTADWAKLLDVLRTITACPLPPPPPPPAPLPLLQRWKVFLSAEICLKKKHAIHMNNSNNSRGYIIMLENESLKDKKKKRKWKKKKNEWISVASLSLCFLGSSPFVLFIRLAFVEKEEKRQQVAFFFFAEPAKKKKKEIPFVKHEVEAGQWSQRAPLCPLSFTSTALA